MPGSPPPARREGQLSQQPSAPRDRRGRGSRPEQEQDGRSARSKQAARYTRAGRNTQADRNKQASRNKQADRGPSRSRRLKDRLLTAFCVLAAIAVAILGLSRGNPRAAAIGAGIFLGYALLHAVMRRLEPTARLVSGLTSDENERLVHYKATRTAGQTALGLAVVGIAMSMFPRWDTGLWIAGTALLILASFVVGLWWFGRDTDH